MGLAESGGDLCPSPWGSQGGRLAAHQGEGRPQLLMLKATAKAVKPICTESTELLGHKSL